MPEDLSLFGVLVWLAYSGGSGIAMWWLIDHVGFLKALQPDIKRYAGLLLPGGLALLAWGAILLMNYAAVPTNAREWIEAAFSVALPAILAAQTAHGATVLRARRRE